MPYFYYMKTTNISGQRVKRAVVASGFTKEQVVASVQDLGFRFSIAGLDKVYRGDLPMHDSREILEAIALKCGCMVTDFFDREPLTA